MTNAQAFLRFMRGWYHGAGRRPIDKECEADVDRDSAKLYIEGYMTGQKDSRRAAAEASKRFNYKPLIIKTQ